MKKNIFTIVIMAISLVNLVLSAVLVFSVMPAMNKTSNLIDKVASVIDLEIESDDENGQDYKIEDLQTVEITYEQSQNIRLQNSDDKAHYIRLDGIVVSFNSKAEDFSTVYESINTTNVYANDIVRETISEFTIDDISETKVKQIAIKRLQEKYNTKCIVDISLTGFLPA